MPPVTVTPSEPPALGGACSPLSEIVHGHDASGRAGRRRDRVAQYVVHMTGSGIVAKAIKLGVDPIAHCLAYYAGKATSSHYLIGYDGRIHWLTDERIRVGHVGVDAPERTLFASGAWATSDPPPGVKDIAGRPAARVTPEALDQWRRAWPGRRSPLDLNLEGARSINDLTVASEMPPAGLPRAGGFEPLPGLDVRPGTRHTEQQHAAVARLAADLARRWAWPADWPFRASARVLGHEDCDPWGRWDGRGGVDPGALRSAPWWDWPHVFALATRSPT